LKWRVLVREEIWTPSFNIWFLGPPNDISMGSAVFARLTRVSNAHTDRRTDNATCDIWSYGSPLCNACRGCGL